MYDERFDHRTLNVERLTTLTQEREIRIERHDTTREVVRYLVEGDLSAARARLTRGFERQVRLAGLERIVRDSEKEQD